MVSEEVDPYGPKIEPLSVTLQFTYGPKYPDEEPLFELVDVDGLPDDSDSDDITDLINTQVQLWHSNRIKMLYFVCNICLNLVYALVYIMYT